MATENDLLRIIVAVLAVLVLVPVLLMLFMMPMMGMMPMAGGHMADGGTGAMTGASWTWALLWLVPLAVVVGIGYLVYRVVRQSADGTDPAIEELRRAYARGELTDEEFEARRERLRRD